MQQLETIRKLVDICALGNAYVTILTLDILTMREW
jgi:hypothetical protein